MGPGSEQPETALAYRGPVTLKGPVVLVALAILVGACSGSSDPERAEVPRPPDVVVHGGGRTLRLRPYTFSWGHGSADGFPPAHPADIGTPRSVTVDLPGEGWSVYGNFGPPRQPDPAGTPFSTQCGRLFSRQLATNASHRLVIRPRGPAGTYEVNVHLNSTRQREGRSVTFRWTTPVSGPVNHPRSETAILANHDGRVDSYGVEFSASDLAFTPKDATAAITVTAANGRSTTIPLIRNMASCTEGTVSFAGTKEAGMTAARLGPKPFRYDVELKMDGVRYQAHAVWPRDEQPDNEPNVGLRFTPALPAFVVER